METFEAIAKRVSIRKYAERDIDNDIIERLVDAGSKAPTARKVEPWHFIVIKDRKVLKQIAEIAINGKFIKDAACCLAVYCEDTKYYLEDGSAATENILLGAADMGLGACWVAGDKKEYTSQISGILGVPDGMKLVSLLSLGWPAEERAQSRSKKVEDIIHWERF